jgi:tRNA threonylcarbamoyladenosine biosynthesis protein TsaE
MGASERKQRRRRVLSASSEETEAIGSEIAARLRPGDVVAVTGELGAGKTTLIRGACRGLGVEGPVTSPTFTIGQRYRGREVWVSHLDLYRLGGIEDEEPALLEDYLREDSVAFVEWPAAAGARLGEPSLRISMSHAGGDRRQIELDSAPGGSEPCS